MLFLTQNNHDNYSKIFGLLRYSIFIFFHILSVRLIYVSIDHAPIKHPFLLVLLFLGIAILGAWRTLWSLYLFVAAIPLVSGLQVLGFMRPIPMLSLMFASIYLIWLPKRLSIKKEGISPRTGIGNLVDILSGVVLLSLIFTLGVYPTDLVLNQICFFPQGMDERVYGIEAVYVLLQGLFFYRIMEEEVISQRAWKIMIQILYIQASMIILFSFIQLIFRTPDPLYGFAIFAPFEGIHSYGSYIAALFFIFLAIVYGGHLRQKLFTGPFLALILLFVILSYSRATWLAVMVVSTVFLINKLSMRKKVLVISSILLVLLMFNLFPNILIKSNQNSLNRLGHLLVLREQLSDYSRVVLWKRALNIIGDFPITGSGIGTFWKISPIYQDFSVSEFKDYYENAHNYFLQFASDLGLPALLIFLSILFFTYKAGFRVSSQVPEVAPFVKGLLLGLSAYLITCMTGHPLLLSNQQFLFWCVISMIVTPHAFASHHGGDRAHRLSRDTSTFMVVLTMIVIAGYALEYFPGFWRMSNEERKYEYGFYSYEDWNDKKVRWMAKKAFSKTFVTGSVMDFDVYATPHNIGPKGLNFKVFINGKLWDEINFFGKETRNLKFYVPYKKNEPIELKTVVNKTFIPIRLGLNKDPRTLGVGISEIRFDEEVPPEGIGFWGMETWTGEPISEWPQNAQEKFRWTGLRASMNFKVEPKNKVTLFLIVAHPDADKNPVRVEISTDGGFREEVIFTDRQWKKVLLSQEAFCDSKVLTFHVSRTWNPKLSGLSEDHRDLGVVVAIPGYP